MLEFRKILSSRGTVVEATDFRAVTHKTTADRLIEGIPPIDFIWRNWIPRNRVVVVAGAGGVGKSSLLTGLAVARALGLPYFMGVAIKPGATLIALGEDYLEDGERRLAAWLDFLTEHKPTRDQSERVARMVSFMVLTGMDTRLVSRPKRDFVPDMANAAGIAAQVKEMKPRPDLVVIETVARFGGDESNQSHAAMIAACEMITQEAEVTVALVSHTGKSSARDGVFDAYAARGGSALVDNARATLVFGRMPLDKATQRMVIGRDALPGEAKCFVLKLTRATYAPPQPAIIISCQSNLEQLVLERVDEVPIALLMDARYKRGQAIRRAIIELQRQGKTITHNVLRTNIGLMNPDIAVRDLRTCIEDAIEDKLIVTGRKVHGGYSYHLAPDPARPVLRVIEMDNWEVNVDFSKFNLH